MFVGLQPDVFIPSRFEQLSLILETPLPSPDGVSGDWQAERRAHMAVAQKSGTHFFGPLDGHKTKT